MAIDFEKIKEKTKELDKSRLTLVSLLNTLESSNFLGEELTPNQIVGLATRLKSEANTLKDLASDVKALVL